MLTPARLLTPIVAAFIAANGWIHFTEWNDVYRSIPAGSVDGAFMVQEGFLALTALCVLGSVALMAGLIRTRLLPSVIVANVVVQASSLIVLTATRRTSVMGWIEPVWTDAASQTRAVEIAAVTGLVVLGLLVVRGHAHRPVPRRAAAV